MSPLILYLRTRWKCCGLYLSRRLRQTLERPPNQGNGPTARVQFPGPDSRGCVPHRPIAGPRGSRRRLHSPREAWEHAHRSHPSNRVARCLWQTDTSGRSDGTGVAPRAVRHRMPAWRRHPDPRFARAALRDSRGSLPAPARHRSRPWVDIECPQSTWSCLQRYKIFQVNYLASYVHLISSLHASVSLPPKYEPFLTEGD